MVKRSFAGRAPTLDEMMAAQRLKNQAAADARAANLTTLQTTINTINAANAAQQAVQQVANAAVQKAAQQAATQQAANAAVQKATQQAAAKQVTQQATVQQQAVATTATNSAAKQAANTAAQQAAVSNAIASTVQQAAANTASAAAATAAATKAAQTAKVASLPFQAGRFARSASNVPKTGDQVVVNGQTYTSATKDRSVQGTTLSQDQAKEATKTANKSTLSTASKNTTTVGPSSQSSAASPVASVSSTPVLSTASKNTQLIGGNTQSSAALTGTAKTASSTGATAKTTSSTSAQSKGVDSSTTVETTAAKTTSSTASASSSTASASSGLSFGRFTRDSSTAINTTDEYITINGKKYKNGNYKPPEPVATVSTTAENTALIGGTTSGTYYDVDASLASVYSQAAAAGISIAKPTTYGQTITDQAQAQKIIDDYVAKANSAGVKATTAAASAPVYDISSNIADVNKTLKDYNLSVSAPATTQYSSQADAQAALNSYIDNAQKAMDTWTQSQPVKVYDDLGREQNITYSQYQQMDAASKNQTWMENYTVLPEEVANSGANWRINSNGLYEWEPVTQSDKDHLAQENAQRARFGQAPKTTLTCGASPSAAYSAEWYSTGGNRTSAGGGSGSAKLAALRSSSTINASSSAKSNTAQTAQAKVISSPAAASKSLPSSSSSKASALTATTTPTLQEQMAKNKSITPSTPKVIASSVVSDAQKAAELTGITPGAAAAKSAFTTGNSALATYNRTQQGNTGNGSTGKVISVNDNKVTPGTGTQTKSLAELMAVNSKTETSNHATVISKPTEADIPTTYIQGDKNKLVTYIANSDNVTALNEQWDKIEAASYNKNVLSTAEKQNTINPNYSAALETAKAEAAKQEQLRQQIIANPLLDAAGNVINQITDKYGKAKVTISGTAAVVTPIYASQESKANALAAAEHDYETLVGLGLRSSKNEATGKSILAAQAVDSTTQYYEQNAKQTATNTFEAAAKRNPFSVINSGGVDRSEGWGVLTGDKYADKVAEALTEAKQINPNGSEEYFQGVADVARRNQMGTVASLQEDRANANKKVAGVLAPVFSAAEGVKSKYDNLLSQTSISLTDTGQIYVTKKGNEPKVTDVTFNAKEAQDSAIESNIVLSGAHQFLADEYNTMKTRPVDYVGELGLMYAGGALFGAGTKLATTGARSGIIKAGEKLASAAPKVAKISSTAAKTALSASGLLVQGSRYVEPVTNIAFMGDIGYNLLSTARKGEYETVFEMGKSLAVGGLGYKKGLETTIEQPFVHTAETNLLDVPSLQAADILPGVRTAKIVRVRGNTESARSDIAYGKTLTVGSKPLLTVVTTKGTRGISLGAAAAPESLLAGKTSQAFSKLETNFFKKTVAERGKPVETEYLDSALNIAKQVSRTREPLYTPETFKITSEAIPAKAKSAITQGITSYAGEIQVTGSVPMKAQAAGFVTRTTHDLEIYGDDAGAIATHLGKSLESQGLQAGTDFRVKGTKIEFPQKNGGWDTGVEIFSHTDVPVAVSSGSPAPTTRPGESEIAFGYESRKPVIVDADNGKFVKTQALAEQLTRKVAGSTFLENKELVPQHIGRYKDIQDTITTATAFGVKGKVPIEKDVVSFVNSAYKKFDNVPRYNEKTKQVEIPFDTVKQDPLVEFIHIHQRLPTEAELSPESFAWKRNAVGKYDLVNKQTGEVVRKNISKDEMLASKKVEKNLNRTVNNISDRSLLYERKARDEISGKSRSPSPSSRLTTRGSPSPGALASSPRSMVSPSPSTRLSSPSPVSRMISQSPKTVSPSPSQTSRMVSPSPRSTSPSPSPRSQSPSPRSTSPTSNTRISTSKFTPTPVAPTIITPIPSPVSPRRESPRPSIISPSPKPSTLHWDSSRPPRNIPSIPPGGPSPQPPSPSPSTPSPSPSQRISYPPSSGDDSSVPPWFKRSGGWHQPPYPELDESAPDKPGAGKRIRVPKRQRENVLNVKTEVSTFKQMFGDKKRRGKPRL